MRLNMRQNPENRIAPKRINGSVRKSAEANRFVFAMVAYIA
jgi:hypothetical protein